MTLWRSDVLSRGVRTVVTGGTEVVAAVVLVLLCFLAFTVILFASFPAGSELGDFFASVNMPAEGRGSVRFEDRGRGLWRDLVASLSSVRRSVKSRPADSVAWSDASPGLPLANRDAVQTFERSVATISFNAPNELKLGENSLVVVRSAEQDQQTGRRRATVLLEDGEMRGAVESRGSRPMDLHVLVGAATARVVSSESRPGRFRLAAPVNRPSIVSVFEGAAEVSSPRGTASIAANMYVSVDAAGAISAPRPLPPIPELTVPASAEIRQLQEPEAEVRFEWSRRAGPDSYHLVIATDPQFDNVVYEWRPESPELVQPHLKPGRYYWRVSSRRGDAESDWSPTRRLDLKRDAEPPGLRVEFPSSEVEQASVVVSGTTEPGARVYIAGKSVRVDGHGRFEAPVDLQHGVNLLVVEAVDASGNVSYASQLVTTGHGVTKRPS